MKTYYIGQMQYSSDDIFHYGRKGMKWGKNIFGDMSESVKTDLFRNAQQQRGQAKYMFDVATNNKRSHYSPSGASNMAEAKKNYSTNWIPKAKGISDWFTGNHLKKSSDMHNRFADDFRDWSRQSSNVAYGHYDPGDKYTGPAEGWRRQARAYASDAAQNETQARLLEEEYQKAPRQVINRAVNNGKEIIGDFVGDTGNKAKDVAKDIGNAAEKAGKAVSKAAGDVSNWTSKAAKDVADWGGAQVSKGQKWVDQAVKDVSKTADKAVKGASDWVSNASKDVGKAAKKTASDVSNAADKAVKDTSKWVSNAAKDVGNAADKAGKAVKKAAKSVSSWSSNAAKDVGSWGSKQLSKGKSFLKKVFG